MRSQKATTHLLCAQGNAVTEEGAEGRMQSAQQAFEEAGQLVVDADQAQEEAAAARQEADRLIRSPQASTHLCSPNACSNSTNNELVKCAGAHAACAHLPLVPWAEPHLCLLTKARNVTLPARGWCC